MLRALYQKAHLYLVYVGLLVLLLLIPLMPHVKIWLKSNDSWPIWIFGFTIIFGAFFALNMAYFQGNQWFGWLGGMGVIGVVVKIIFSVLLVNVGFGVKGALGGALLSYIFIWGAGRWLIFSAFPELGCDAIPLEHFDVKEVLPILIANIAFAAMTQLDMVLVNWFFPSEQAGMYAAASVLGKAVLYLPGGLVLALYPMVVENHSQHLGSARILLTSVLTTGFICGFVALVYLWGGKWLIGIFYGADYADAGILLQWYGLAIFPMTLVMVAEHFLMAKGKVLFAWLFLAMAPLQITAINLWHAELIQVVSVMGVSGATLVVVGYGMLWRDYRRSL
jgi:O-antigen/teichoic acid export membrane protein